jgi:small subunit ribosomal protein S13
MRRDNIKTIRILSIPLPRNKPLFLRLKKIKGLGEKRINMIIQKAVLLKNKKLRELNPKESLRLIRRVNYYRIVKKWILTTKLNRSIENNIKVLQDIKTFRGLRHQFRLPTRGQRTRSNRKTTKRLLGISKSK